MAGKRKLLRTLAIDIGGSGLKMMVLDRQGKPLTERTRVKTPRPATPQAILDELSKQMTNHGRFERISVGFPGVVLDGVTRTAVNLDPQWDGFPLAETLERMTGRPVRVANDADVQGLAVIEGTGVELVLTLGTGLGSALFLDGKLIPNLELAHHPFRTRRTYEDWVGNAARKQLPRKKWSRRVVQVIDQLEKTFNYRKLYLGGGNATKITMDLPENVEIVPNLAGLLGGIRLWN